MNVLELQRTLSYRIHRFLPPFLNILCKYASLDLSLKNPGYNDEITTCVGENVLFFERIHYSSLTDLQEGNLIKIYCFPTACATQRVFFHHVVLIPHLDYLEDLKKKEIMWKGRFPSGIDECGASQYCCKAQLSSYSKATHISHRCITRMITSSLSLSSDDGDLSMTMLLPYEKLRKCVNC